MLLFSSKTWVVHNASSGILWSDVQKKGEIVKKNYKFQVHAYILIFNLYVLCIGATINLIHIKEKNLMGVFQ